jgi:predicted ribonuclease YlaK
MKTTSLKTKSTKIGKKPIRYVLDTTTILYRPEIFYHLQGRIYVSTAVIKEIDGHKKAAGDRGAAARKAARILDILGSYEDFDESKTIAEGVRLSTGATVMVYPFADTIDDLDSEEDNRIVGAAIRIKRETGEEVVLLTSDINMRTVARAYKIKARLYPAYAEDIHVAIAQTQTPSTAQERREIEGYKLPETIGARARSIGSAVRKRVQYLSPFYWLGKLLRYCLRDKDKDLFWTMDDDTYRLCAEYREGGRVASKK